MTKQTLDKANDLQEKISDIKMSLDRIQYMQSENVVVREFYIKCNGMETVVAPKEMFRIVGLLVKSELNKQLTKLEKEFNKL